MDDEDQRLLRVARDTHVVRPPRQALATFGATVIRYYLVSEPVYAELDAHAEMDEAVVREGTVRADRPRVVTPFYLLRHEGFGKNAGAYLQEMAERFGHHSPGLLYSYRNEPAETSIVSGRPGQVASRIGARLDREHRGLEAVIRGVDELWDVSLMKFIYELTNASLSANAAELGSKGLLEMERDVPREARQHIEHLLEQARHGQVNAAEVHRELERWDLFDEYQDRFLALFRGR
jgi:hypothetical protein